MNLRTVDRQFRVYLHRLAWIMRDLVRTFPGRVATVTLAYGAAVVFFMGTLGLLFLYLRQLAGRDTGAIMGITIPELPRYEGSMILVPASIIAILGFASVFGVYLGQWAIARMAVAYQRECERRLFRIAADPDCRGWGAFLPGPSMGEFSSLRSFACKVIAMTTRRLMRLLLPGIVFVVSSALLIIKDWKLTLLLLPLGIFYIVPMYLANRGAAKTQRRYLKETPPIRRNVGNTLKSIVERDDLSQEEKDRLADEVLDDPAYTTAGLLFFRRRLLSEQSKLINLCFMVLAVVTLFIYASFVASNDPTWWEHLLVYVIALRFMIGSMQLLTGTLIKTSRFLPNYRVYVEFIQDVEKMRRRRRRNRDNAGLPDEPLVVRIGKGTITGSANRLTIDTPGPLWILCPHRLNAPDLEGLVVMLENRARNAPNLLDVADIIVGDDDEPSRMATQWQNLSRNEFQEALDVVNALGMTDELSEPIRAIRDGDDVNISRLSREALWSFIAAPKINADQVLVVDASSLNRIEPEFVSHLTDVLKDHFLILATRDTESVTASPMFTATRDGAAIAVMDSIDLVAGGDAAWFEANRAEIDEHLATAAPAGADDSELTDLDEFEE